MISHLGTVALVLAILLVASRADERVNDKSYCAKAGEVITRSAKGDRP